MYWCRQFCSHDIAAKPDNYRDDDDDDDNDDDDGGDDDDDDDDDGGGDDDDDDDDDGDGLCDIDQILIISRTPKEDSALFSQSAK